MTTISNNLGKLLIWMKILISEHSLRIRHIFFIQLMIITNHILDRYVEILISNRYIYIYLHGRKSAYV